jgi:hypothetical protein
MAKNKLKELKARTKSTNILNSPELGTKSLSGLAGELARAS